MGGGSSSYAESMFRMTEMLEMNSIMLDQLQEHVSMTYNRLRDVVMWVWALKDMVFKRDLPEKTQETQGMPEQTCFESDEAKHDAVQRVKRRVRVLTVLLGLFLYMVLRDSWRRWRDLEVDSIWLKVAEDALQRGPAVPVVDASARV